MCTQEGWLEYFLMLIMRKVVPPDKPKNSQSHERANFKQGVGKKQDACRLFTHGTCVPKSRSNQMEVRCVKGDKFRHQHNSIPRSENSNYSRFWNSSAQLALKMWKAFYWKKVVVTCTILKGPATAKLHNITNIDWSIIYTSSSYSTSGAYAFWIKTYNPYNHSTLVLVASDVIRQGPWVCTTKQKNRANPRFTWVIRQG